MKVYQLQHIPSGLYFCPVRDKKVTLIQADGTTEHRYLRSNLSKMGKVYQKRPSAAWLGSVYYTHLITHQSELNSPQFSQFPNCCVRPVIESEWQIVETKIGV